MTPADIGVVILTQGTRPDDLRAAIASVRSQVDVSTDIVVVGNGWEPTGLPAGVKSLGLPHNLGIPAGRNEGVGHVEGEVVFFLDDDARLADERFLATSLERLREHPGLGVVQGRVTAPDGSPGPARWVPKLGSAIPSKPTAVFSVWEGALAIRREALEAAGRWPAQFIYAHEGIELAWRVWDAGFRVEYHPDLIVHHPIIDPRRHRQFLFLTARNRVWVARRNLPWPLSIVYALNWAAIHTFRSLRRPREITPWWRGWWAGWHHCPRQAPRLRWRSVWRMARAGRLLVI